jgi:hypothetical protein
VSAGLDLVVARLTERGCGPKPCGSEWSARCPCPEHDDKTPSLSVGEGKNGKPVLHCFAGCQPDEVIAALGLTWRDLCGDDERQRDVPLVVYTYFEESGEAVGYVKRWPNRKWSQARPDGNGGMVNKKPTCPVPYRLPELARVPPGEMVFIPEGEKDADTLAREGLVATTNPMGAGKWPSEWGERYFQGLSVVVLADNDDAGRRHAQQVVASVLPYACEVRLLELPGLPEKGDVTDWLLADHSVDELLDLVEATEPVTEANDNAEDELLLELIDWSVVHDPADDLVERYVMPGRWTQNVVGAKGGKSSWTMWLAVELSEGRDPVDGTPAAPVTVLYCDAEMGRDDLEALIRDMGHEPLALSNLHCSERRPRLDTDLGAAMLLGRVDRLGARLVVLDGLNGYIAPEADENASSTWRAIFDYTVQPLKDRGVAVLSNDNMGKDPTRGSRGNSAKTDKADGVVVAKKTEQGLSLRTTHARAGAYFDHLDLNAEGFDRSKPIRYWRGSGGWPSGTQAAVQLLDRLGIPLEWGGKKVRQAVRAANETVSNEALAGAIRFRKANLIRP